MHTGVAISGIGMVTPLGWNPAEVLSGIEAGKPAAAAPTRFNAATFSCPLCAEVRDFLPPRFVPEAKLIRLMSRDAQFAVAAAHLALADAGVVPGKTHPSEAIALYGATGLAGLPLTEVVPLIKASAGPDGRFDPSRFGQDGLRAVSPILSFKILSNMPLCFVSICENIQGPNSIYTPWEGQGAQAIEAGIRAIESGEARCALVGGCDVKTHELAFLTLEQHGLFASWREHGVGLVPGEGAAFLVLETLSSAAARGARTYARISRFRVKTRRPGTARADACLDALKKMELGSGPLAAVVGADNGDVPIGQAELKALAEMNLTAPTILHPKRHVGDLFAAAAGLQIALGALLAARGTGRVLAHCFGPGTELAAVVLDPP